MNRQVGSALLVLAICAGLLPRLAMAQPSMPAAFPIVKPVIAYEHNSLFHPIQLDSGSAQLPDRSYPYGSTQGGARAVHLGVELASSRGTAVYASRAGKVIFAGTDDKTKLGPRLDYYGKVVIIAHAIESPAGEQIFTLYGHLDRIAVEAGQQVDDLELIGHVGTSGIAIGAHLHFEVRADDPFNYRATRNPALWLRHAAGSGLLIGAVREAAGEFVYNKRLVLRNHAQQREVFTYASSLVNPDTFWEENFTISDLPAGEYELIALSDAGGIAYREGVTVAASRATYVSVGLG